VKIRLNGEPADVPDAITIEALLARLGIDPRRVAVEHNLTIIKRDRQAAAVIHDGDEVEIVNFVGGG
jgi:thiamine biosynthesis protein ThiS